MIENVISKRYAKALSGSIVDESSLRRALENLKDFGDAFDVDGQLEQFFSHPGISEAKKNALVSELCDQLKTENVVRNLLKMLVQRRKILFLKNIADYFESVVDPELIVPDTSLTIRDGAIKPWEKRTSVNFHQMLESLAKHFNFKLNIPFKNIPKATQNILFYGAGKEIIKYIYEQNSSQKYYAGNYDGVIIELEQRYRETDSSAIREEISKFMRILPCSVCEGTRLKKEGTSVRVGEYNIIKLTEHSIGYLHSFFKTLKLSKQENNIARRIVKEIIERLGFLFNVGLDYLTLNRSSATLSGGESQRIRLATQIGSSLMGVLYVLDEPSIGLHQRDNDRLLKTLLKLRDLGNTVIVVEHDEKTILSADHVIDIGLGAGVHGGEVIYSGIPKKLLKDKISLTGQYLSGRKKIRIPVNRNGNGSFLEIKGASQNNLKGIDVKIPLGCLVCVTGVSGSGKSTLIIDILYKALARHFWNSTTKPGKYKTIEGVHLIDKVIDIDQSPIGRTPRSNPATYTGVFTLIRDLFSQIPEARTRGYKPGRFSFNVKGGRCEACQGDGVLKVEMHFLPDIFVTCEICSGKRFNRETLEIPYRGKNIADVLEMTTEEAKDFFINIPSIKSKLQTIADVGLNYIQLGQAATTLSGGEAQRVKLSKELSKRSTGRTLYILDEPTTGLHFADIEELLKVLSKLVNSGNTIIIIEHNMDVIKTADHIIDLGPEGGDKGGELLADGTPKEVAKVKESHTGQYLKKLLKMF